LAANPPRFTGTVTLDPDSQAPTVLAVTALRQVIVPRGRKAAFAGAYTLALPRNPARDGDATYPQGHGYAKLTVAASGSVALAGTLGDGQAFSAGGLAAANGTWVLFAQPYKGKGVIAGSLGLAAASGQPLPAATLAWIKPGPTTGRYAAGFTGTIDVLGSPFKPVAGAAIVALPFAPTLSLVGGGLAPSFSTTTVLDSANHFSFPNAQSRIPSLVLDVHTGLLSGGLRTGTKTMRFGGVFLHQQRSGFGCFVSPDSSGSLELTP
jgi:hypothetical protein